MKHYSEAQLIDKGRARATILLTDAETRGGGSWYDHSSYTIAHNVSKMSPDELLGYGQTQARHENRVANAKRAGAALGILAAATVVYELTGLASQQDTETVPNDNSDTAATSHDHIPVMPEHFTAIPGPSSEPLESTSER